MSTPKHTTSFDRETGKPTPGEWFTVLDLDKNKAWIHAKRKWPESACVAEVKAETILSDELEANARLIAAAPALLEACKRLLSRVQHHTFNLESCDIGVPDERAIKEAGKAIAQAEGEV